ncbi:hypothetical protein MG293_006891 [Ovis ammon polii]|uniref:17-beta-hydroxysteroid dehydrogenase 13 n=1 Tax=Ovis ammon polii TaxID=230172 RepID=A0AAD4UFR2_OVIAM|nr:hypothetical protein MG293_006891 [Ovis ammon polii]KAI4572229.1 hypothetical protein MJT46_005297 [Ovis ammon polii x Ovis aries]
MKIILDLLLLLLIIVYSYLESLLKVFIPRRRKSVAGEIVLITGAGHGIGRQTAYEFAQRKSRLVLWDINKHGVEETAAECRKLGATTHVFVVDCSNREEIYSSVDQVKKEVGDVTIVVNNAGAIYPADLLSTKDEEITKTFEVNILGHFWRSQGQQMFKHENLRDKMDLGQTRQYELNPTVNSSLQHKPH